ncbi:MAG: sodium/hydrogen exchanger family/TrkA domain protein [Nitrospinaceae bacterium]|nr:MAG: sodium/hydrogen exchanger family/TrkA domain protein [Nitrospinaceae bacterium]
MDDLIKDLAILLLVSLPINIVFHRIKLPSVMGFLLAGVIIGPYGLQLIQDSDRVKHLAEIGVILLLFVIGLEFSIKRMLKDLGVVLGVGGLQLGLTGALIFFIFISFGYSANQGVLFGLLIALSSTAIVLKMITDRAEIDTKHGGICIGTLLFQDLCVVPMMLIIPLLSQTDDLSPLDFGMAVLKSIAAVSAIVLFSRMLVPRSLGAIARMGSKEHLTLFVILIILGTGWVSESMGLSLAMGAFIAGIIISDSEYSHQIILDILPLKDYFGSIFFISVGMLLQVQVFYESALWYLGLTAGVIALKAVLAFLACFLLRNTFRVSFIVGIRLAQVGEFSLLLASLALESDLFLPGQYQSFLIVSILSMLAAPILIQVSAGLSIKINSLFGAVPYKEPEPLEPEKLSGHVIITGYGLVGRNLSRVLKETHTPFVVLELDGERIKEALKEDVQARFGDSTHRDTLLRAGINHAKMMVFAVSSDPMAAVQAVRLARQMNPDIYILVRVRYAAQVDELNAAGADQVIPEEFETSIEIFSRVLREYHISNNVIEQQVELARLEGYGMFRGLSLNMESMKKFSAYMTASLTESFHVLEDSWCHNQSIKELKLHKDSSVKLIAVVRNNDLQANPDPDLRFQGGDIIILFGRHANLDRSLKYLRSGTNE